METSGVPRKGARRMADITPEVLAGLNDGTLETASLPEGLAVDFAALLRAAAPELPASWLERVDAGEGITRRMAVVGRLLHEHHGEAAYERFHRHPSDTVRGWAAYALAQVPGLSVADRLERVRPLADDRHFGVREWAWIALRPHVAADVPAAVRALTPWTGEVSTNVRRFAVEITRPRGVWCAHIPLLREQPELGLPLLEPVRADPSRYVQDSVANWLNDASRTRPEWVRALCRAWQKKGCPAATERICRRALRTLTARQGEGAGGRGGKRADALPGLGAVSRRWLAEVGVHTREDLEGLGALAAYRLVCERQPRAGLSLLYALHGALTGRAGKDLSPRVRERLRRAAEKG